MGPSQTLAQLSTFVDAWIELVGMQSLADMREGQTAPWASISQGAAGHAYALWHVGQRRDRSALASGRKWVKLAHRAAKLRSGFWTPDMGRTRLAGSVIVGRPGVHVVDALLADDRPRVRERALAAFAAAVRRTRRSTSTEHFMGRAGSLMAALALWKHTGAESMRELADELAQQLLTEPAIPVNGFAHGHVGVQHSLMVWSQQTGTELGPAFFANVVAPTDDAIIARVPHWAATWCNGLTGFVLLWVKAYELTRDAKWRDRARTAMALVPKQGPTGGSLCCGAGGQAYAALALGRIDDSEDWRTRAIELCGRSLGGVLECGVLKGLGGTVCLATDLLAGGDAKFPLVDL